MAEDMMNKILAFIADARMTLTPEAQGRLQAHGEVLAEAIDEYKRRFVEQRVLDRAELHHRVRLVVLAVTQGKPCHEEYANLQEWAIDRHMVEGVPWRELNDVIETHTSEAELESIKLAAANKLGGRRSAILRKANPIRNTRGTGPVASYSAALKARAGRSTNGNRGS
jgi:hypothetical protein